jgi:hypothetical protein
MNDFLIEDVAQIPLVERRILSGLSNRIELGSELTPWDIAMWRIADWRRRETAD